MIDSVQRSETGGNIYDAVFTDKTDNSALDASDFLQLIVLQLQNQDFTNPMDNSEMVSQMATFSNMQMMQEMASYSKTLYAMGLVGKTVTASRYTVSGGLDTTTGIVQKVSLVDNEYLIYVGGKTYSLNQIMSVGAGSEISGGGSSISPENFSLTAKEVSSDSVTLNWEIPTEDMTESGSLRYTVYYSTEGPMDSLEEVEAAQKFGMQTTDLGMTVTGLEADQTYYFNVVVTDANGNKAIYKPVTVTTKI